MQNPLTPLIDQLTKLPGVGPRSAARMAFFFLTLPSKEVEAFANVLATTKRSIRYCETCFNISLTSLCVICQNEHRLRDTLCIVSEPKDVFAIEKAGMYKGVYHVLGGLISPLDGMHPDMLRLTELVTRMQKAPFKEVILALNPTIEGDATSLYIQSILSKFGVPLSKLAFGLPVGSDLEYADELTLQKAFEGRR